jgi:hypothetical protein
MDSIASPKVKAMEGGVGVHSLARSTSGVEGHVEAPRWDEDEWQVSIIHMDVQKPNNKLISS